MCGRSTEEERVAPTPRGCSAFAAKAASNGAWTGRIRVPLAAAEENNEEPGHIVHLPAIANDFTHPDPPAILEVVVEEVSGTSLQEELEVVVKKIKDTVETDDITSKKVNKLGSEIKYLKTAVVLTEQFEQYFK